MRKMKSAVCLSISTLLIGISLSNYAQKRWDGEEGDGQWNSARNWLPDGVPLYNEAVILNNEFIPSSYHVTLPFSNTVVEFFSLQINGSPQQVVSLEIPDGSTASPAIITQNITIGKNGIIVNSSGAAAGNTFSLSGFIKFEETVLFPNPVSTTLCINLAQDTEPCINMYVVTQQGQLIQPRWRNNNGTYEIDVRLINKGVYTILLYKKNRLVECKQFIKE
ncbi:MAG: hypothetical protein CK547_02870 [Chitinophagaceae bacterium]|nr:MAG: hypothetical protein CK547_02870 [Chitinophagaceae bacterium]